MTWVLILTISLYGGGAAIHSIPGFTSQKECMDAANAWVANRTAGNVSAICVQQGAKS